MKRTRLLRPPDTANPVTAVVKVPAAGFDPTECNLELQALVVRVRDTEVVGRLLGVLDPVSGDFALVTPQLWEAGRRAQADVRAGRVTGRDSRTRSMVDASGPCT
jgi:hypothetical protein